MGSFLTRTGKSNHKTCSLHDRRSNTRAAGEEKDRQEGLTMVLRYLALIGASLAAVNRTSIMRYNLF